MTKPVNAIRLCADRILTRIEFMGSSVYLNEHSFEEMSKELEVILHELMNESLLTRQDLIDYCAEYCDMEK